MSTEREKLEELYQAWRDNTEARPGLEQQMAPLLERHASTVYWMVLRRWDSENLKDMVHDVLFHLSDFEGRSAFSTWVHRVFLNAAYNYRREERRRREVPLEPDMIRDRNWEELSNAKITTDQILESLSDEDRGFLELCRKDYSQAEIAAALGISQPTVAVKQKRIFRRLAKKYESSK